MLPWRSWGWWESSLKCNYVSSLSVNQTQYSLLFAIPFAHSTNIQACYPGHLLICSTVDCACNQKPAARAAIKSMRSVMVYQGNIPYNLESCKTY